MTCFQNRGSYRINKVSRVFISHHTGLSSEFISGAKYSHANFSFLKELKEMQRVGEGARGRGRGGEKSKGVRIKGFIASSVMTEDKPLF